MTMTLDRDDADTANDTRLGMLWLEITGQCQLSCSHCYAGSGPDGSHGSMTTADWERVLGEAAALGARMVQFIGGEPTLHPDLPRLIRRALSLGLQVEVFSNLVHVSDDAWEAFSLPGVRLATSWYSDDREQHRQVTGRDTWRQTKANAQQALQRGIPLRAGVIDGIIGGQRAAAGQQQLLQAGVPDVGVDVIRDFGRGTKPDPSQACGHCGHGRAAVLPDGSVTPCPLTRWMTAGNVRQEPLADTLGAVAGQAATLPARPQGASCEPTCLPDSYCPPLCTPGACKPWIS